VPAVGLTEQQEMKMTFRPRVVKNKTKYIKYITAPMKTGPDEESSQENDAA